MMLSDAFLGTDTLVWRYMDFARFVSLLSKQALWFSRVDALEDKWECRTQYTFDSDIIARAAAGTNVETRAIERALSTHFETWARRHVYVNCWHIGEHDSVAMWKVYSSVNAGIAVTSRVHKLQGVAAQFQKSAGESLVFCNALPVHYTDSTTRLRQNPTAIYKPQQYAYESEFRIIVYDLECMMADWRNAGKGKARRALSGVGLSGVVRGLSERGFSYPIRLAEVIEEVIVSPVADEFFVDAVGSVAEKYGLAVTPRRSSLAVAPDVV